jgi:aspartate aminotransferase
VDFTPNQVLVSCGAKHALFNLFQALLDPGDAVLIPAPYWVSYPAQVQLADAKAIPVYTSASSGFVPTREALRAAAGLALNAGTRPKAVVINSPSNPTGAGYSRAALEALVEEALSLGICIVSDEIYGRLTYDGFEHVSIPSLSPDAKASTFLIDGVSKTYAMTGWRTGWVLGDEEVIAAAGRLQSQSTSGPSSISQAAALAAITGDEPFLDEWRAAYAQRRNAMVEGLNAIEGVICPSPQGAFYVFPDVSALLDRSTPGLRSDVELALTLLDEAGVACVPGTPFGAPGHLRLSYATSLETVLEGVRRLSMALAR